MIEESIKLPCGQLIKNRFCKSAMTERIAGQDNFVNKRHLNLYDFWSKSGAGILLTGNVQIDRMHMEGPSNVCIEKSTYKEQFKKLKEWAEVSESHGSKLWMQLSHAGRQTPGEMNSAPLAPSSVPLDIKAPGRKFGAPVAMTEEQIIDVINRFIFAATVAQDSGFSGIQIHSAHGYLMSEFLSPDVNKRTDAWGGAIKNRSRALVEIIRGCRKRLGSDFPISVKINSSDFQKGGFSAEDSIEVAKILSSEKIDLLEISGGTYEHVSFLDAGEDLGINSKPKEIRRESTIAREAYFLEYAKDIRKVINIPLMVTGGFRTKKAMNSALKEGFCEVIGVARPLCSHPYCVQDLLDGQIEKLPSYEERLRLGNGWLSPNSPFNLVRAANFLSSQYWFYTQIKKMADGKPPDLSFGPLAALLSEYKIDYRGYRDFKKAI